MNLQGTKLVGEEVVFEGDGFHAIGRDVRLEKCHVKIRVPARDIGIRGEFIECSISAESDLVGLSWLEARLHDCRFEGHFEDNEFGGLDDSGGRCERCSFNDAVLVDCSFFGPDTESIEWRPWPSIVVLSPKTHLNELKANLKNESLVHVVGAIEFIEDEVSAFVFDANALSRRTSVKLRAIEELFSGLSFVLK